MAKISLDQLYFGKDDAESDITKSGLLRAGFLRTRAYEEAVNGRKMLIIGRKGSGKSAICLMLNCDLAAQKRSSLVTPDEISADEIRRFHLPGIKLEQSKQLIWRYVFAVQFAKYLVTYARSAHLEGGAPVQALRRFLLANGEVDDMTVLERFWRTIEKLKGSISVEAFSIRIGAEVEKASPGIRINDQLDIVEQRLREAAQNLGVGADSGEFHILVDQIEKVWSDDRESDALVVGLLQAGKQVRERLGPVTCTLFLRTDIYEKLQFQDRDKFRGDEFHIDWNEESLLELIFARAKASCGKKIQPADLWQNVFPEKVSGRRFRDFLVDRTLLRPRDIIQLCNACRDTAKTNGSQNVSEKDISQALALYSNWKLSDLQSEWAINFPFLPDVFVLLANGSSVINRGAFESRVGKIEKDLANRYPQLTSSLSADALLSILFSIGLVGVIRKGATRYSYQEKVDKHIQASDQQFVLHPCFRNALQSTTALNVAPFVSAIDPEARYLSTRVLREHTPYSHTEAFRGSRPQRFGQYVLGAFDRVLETLSNSTLPSEVSEDLANNLIPLRSEMETAADTYDDIVVRSAARRVSSHLQKLSNRLREQLWLDKAVMSSLSEADELLQEFVYKGRLGEYT